MINESPAGGMTDTAQTLLPCPWCRGAADLYDRAWGKCRDCGAEGPVGDTPEDAIRLWNTRSPDPLKEAAKVRTEALREAAERIKQHLAECQNGEKRSGYSSEQYFAMECSDLAFKTAAELVEALIKTDSGVSIDPAES